MNLFWRTVAVMLLFGWIIWPYGAGLGEFNLKLYSTMPVAAGALTIVILLAIVTLAPLSHKRYTQASILVLLLAIGLAHFKAWSVGMLPFDQPVAWALSLALCAVFAFIAWPMIATNIWQKTHYRRSVDTSNDNTENEGGHP